MKQKLENSFAHSPILPSSPFRPVARRIPSSRARIIFPALFFSLEIEAWRDATQSPNSSPRRTGSNFPFVNGLDDQIRDARFNLPPLLPNFMRERERGGRLFSKRILVRYFSRSASTIVRTIKTSSVIWNVRVQWLTKIFERLYLQFSMKYTFERNRRRRNFEITKFENDSPIYAVVIQTHLLYYYVLLIGYEGIRALIRCR